MQEHGNSANQTSSSSPEQESQRSGKRPKTTHHNLNQHVLLPPATIGQPMQISLPSSNPRKRNKRKFEAKESGQSLIPLNESQDVAEELSSSAPATSPTVEAFVALEPGSVVWEMILNKLDIPDLASMALVNKSFNALAMFLINKRVEEEQKCLANNYWISLSRDQKTALNCILQDTALLNNLPTTTPHVIATWSCRYDKTTGKITLIRTKYDRESILVKPVITISSLSSNYNEKNFDLSKFLIKEDADKNSSKTQAADQIREEIGELAESRFNPNLFRHNSSFRYYIKKTTKTIFEVMKAGQHSINSPALNEVFISTSGQVVTVKEALKYLAEIKGGMREAIQYVRSPGRRFSHHVEKTKARLKAHYEALCSAVTNSRADTIVADVRGELLAAKIIPSLISRKNPWQLKLGYFSGGGTQGIDQIWVERDPLSGKVGKYIIVECKGSANAHYGETQNGTQMSLKWIVNSLRGLMTNRKEPRYKRLAEKILYSIFCDHYTRVEGITIKAKNPNEIIFDIMFHGSLKLVMET